MRILIGPGMVPVEEDGKFAGGAAFATYNIAKSLSELGNDVFLYTLHDTVGCRNGNLEIIRRNKKNFAIKNLLKISKEAKKQKKHIINYFNNKPIRSLMHFSGTYLFWERLIADIKPDIISVHGNNIDRLPMIHASINSRIPLVFTSHGIPEKTELNYDREKFLNDFFGLLKTNNTPIISVSSGLKNRIEDIFNYPSDLLEVIGNGVSNDMFTDSINDHNKKINKNKLRLLTVGSLTKGKNQALVLQTLPKLSNKFEYRIVGDGPEMNNLKKLSKKLKIDQRVKFLGKLVDGKLKDEYKNSDIFVLTSTSEAFGLVFLEALASGLPIVTMKSLEGIVDLYHPDCFQLVKKYDPDELKEAILKSVKKIDNKICKEHAKKFSWEKIAVKYCSIFENFM